MDSLDVTHDNVSFAISTVATRLFVSVSHDRIEVWFDPNGFVGWKHYVRSLIN